MIWLDSSFVIAWLLGSDEAAGQLPTRATLGILPMQFTETLVFFLRKGVDTEVVSAHLETLELGRAENTELHEAARRYVDARKVAPKISLADAILGTVASARSQRVASFDSDFRSLGFRRDGALWSTAAS